MTAVTYVSTHFFFIDKGVRSETSCETLAHAFNVKVTEKHRKLYVVETVIELFLLYVIQSYDCNMIF